MLVIGSGVAGLSSALAAAEAGAEVELVTPGRLQAVGDAVENPDRIGGNSMLAQGGISASIGPGDAAELHAADTVAAGVGLVDVAAAAVLTSCGADEVRALLAAGFAADRDDDGNPALGLEGGHNRARIVHAGEDRSGSALHAFLLARALDEVEAGRLRISEGLTAVGLLNDGQAVKGAVLQAVDGSNTLHARSAEAVVIATGGYAGAFSSTSNSLSATGDGVLLAARTGALLADLEFVQFHPTVLTDGTEQGRRFLISEAVRGAGAVLRDGTGRRFMLDRHPAAELAPRDVVARAIHQVLQERPATAVWLDATGIEAEGGAGTLARRFPRISAVTRDRGFDWTREPVPVAPAAHYAMGGIATDLDGRTSATGLFAAGEVASTGVHGANRLASNSLLECLVFGARAGRAAAAWTVQRGSEWTYHGGSFDALLREPIEIELPRGNALERLPDPADAAQTDTVQTAFDTGLGAQRDADGLRRASAIFAAHPHDARAQLGTLITAFAADRTESRGAHTRSDFPKTDPDQAHRRAGRLRMPRDAAPAGQTRSRPITLTREA